MKWSENKARFEPLFWSSCPSLGAWSVTRNNTNRWSEGHHDVNLGLNYECLNCRTKCVSGIYWLNPFSKQHGENHQVSEGTLIESTALSSDSILHTQLQEASFQITTSGQHTGTKDTSSKEQALLCLQSTPALLFVGWTANCSTLHTYTCM